MNNSFLSKLKSCSLVPPWLGAIIVLADDKASEIVLPKPSGLLEILIIK